GLLRDPNLAFPRICRTDAIDLTQLRHYIVSIESHDFQMKTATLERKTVHTKAKHPNELIRRIQKGLPFSDLKVLQDSIDMPFEQLAAKLSISRSTLQRRKAAGRLSPDESDKVMRFSRLLEHATTVIGH